MTIQAILKRRSGVFRGTTDPFAAATAAEQQGYRFFAIDPGRSKDDLMRAFEVALHFPDYFGHNWDALVDMLRDLSWIPAPGYVLHISSLPGHDRETIEALLEEATAFWRDRGDTPLIVLLDEE